VARVYQMSLIDGAWKLWRDARLLSTFSHGTLSNDGTRIVRCLAEVGQRGLDARMNLTYLKVAPAAGCAMNGDLADLGPFHHRCEPSYLTSAPLTGRAALGVAYVTFATPTTATFTGSRPGATHSRNLADRAEVSMVNLRLTGTAYRAGVPGRRRCELSEATSIRPRDPPGQPERGAGSLIRDDVVLPAPYRLYRASVTTVDRKPGRVADASRTYQATNLTGIAFHANGHTADTAIVARWADPVGQSRTRAVFSGGAGRAHRVLIVVGGRVGCAVHIRSMESPPVRMTVGRARRRG